jgi:hypothetical protein
MQIVACPDPACAVPAEVLDRWSWASTDGPLEHIRVQCVNRHVFTVPVQAAWGTRVGGTVRDQAPNPSAG